MSQHTVVMQRQKRGLRGRRIAIMGVSVPVIPVVLTVLGAGVALAAVLLTTTISGQATITRVTGTANGIAVVGTSDNGTALRCDVAVAPDAKTLTLNTNLKITTNGDNADDPGPVPGGKCTITLAVQNKGTTPIKVDGNQTVLNAPTGYQVTRFEGPAVTGTIAPGDTAELSADITAFDNAVEGPFSGKVVYTDAA